MRIAFVEGTERDQLLGSRIQDGVDDAEDRGVRAAANREREDRDDREAGGFLSLTKSETEFGHMR